MRRKLRVLVLFGGRSAEHRVSLQSAASVAHALDRKKHDVTLVAIDPRGAWRLASPDRFLLDAADPRRVRLAPGGRPVALVPSAAGARLVFLDGQGGTLPPPDVVFPVLHGPLGEDGTMQGYLEIAGVAYVGAGVTGSALGMDKDVMKRLLDRAGIPNAPCVVLRRGRGAGPAALARAARALGLPLFVKPACLGSSIGIGKARTPRELAAAVRAALRHDDKVIVEQFVRGREVECAVLGGARPRASVPGEIVPRHEFYSYEAKYIDEKGADLVVPAVLPPAVARRVRALAVRAFEALCCEGMARVDFFVKQDGEVLVNEINTIPGFTRISMYPKLWEATGLPYRGLVDRLVRLALSRARAARRRSPARVTRSPRP